MSVARHHAEWMSLVESSGPFLSIPVLMRVFPQGLDPRDSTKAAKLREAYEDWLDRGSKRPDVHHAWIRHVLTDLLEYPPEFLVEGQAIPPGMEAAMPNFGETLRPTFALKHRDAGQKPLLLIEHYPPDQDLEKPVSGKLWKATPGTRMMELLHAADVPLGLITNGEEWMLVSAPVGETTGFASWYTDIWMQEPITLRAFHSLLHLRRMMGVAETDTLAALYRESSKDQQDVTDQLGYQVRRAVEMLVSAFDRIDAESGRMLLSGVPEKTLYDSALTVMMRLVFLFSAEERGLLLLGDPLYDQHYAVSTLSEILRERADQQGEEVLERRRDAWCRLLATFRAVHGGVQHESMRLPAYGGTLFDPDRYPFLEGRAAGTRWQADAAAPLPINNRVVLHLLEALQVLRVKVPGGGATEARRLSFRALGVEQIGHVYEGLLDHTAKRAGETILGLAGTRNKEPEIPLSKLEEVAAKGNTALIGFLKEETGRSEKALKKVLEPAALLDEHDLVVACGQDARLAKRVLPFAALVRNDDFGRPVIVAEGSIYVTAGSDRRSTGTHYTPPTLTEPIVKYTLEPLVYIGPAEGKPEDQWQLKSPKEILALKVCDMTMGSGAFLVQGCRYLAERLVEAWELAEKAHPGQMLATPEGEFSKGDPAERLIPADPAERIAIARRYVADRCLYGVDINPMAVEMAKLSVWLITSQKSSPFTFLDHAFKCGDSLLGITRHRQLEVFALNDVNPATQQAIILSNYAELIRVAVAKRRELEALPSNTPAQVKTKEELNAEAEDRLNQLKLAADLLVTAEMMEGSDGQRSEARVAAHLKVSEFSRKPLEEFRQFVAQKIGERRPFHWNLEYPEIFEQGGFDAFIGNPPFMGGQKLTGTYGTDYREYLVRYLGRSKRGSADLAAYFFLRMASLLKTGGNFGLIATNTISQGDTREVGLEQFAPESYPDRVVLTRAVPSRPWPGGASLEVAHVYGRSIRQTADSWKGPFYIDDVPVGAAGITPFLTPPGRITGKPYRLKANEGKSFIGSYVLGMGFVMTPGEARALIARDVRNAEVLMPYLNGEDLNSRPDQSPSRWVINFRDWPLKREVITLSGGERASWIIADEKQRKAWLRAGIVPQDYPDPVAADFPDCLCIVEQKVKPEREKNNRDVYRERWWHFAEKRPELYATIATMPRVLMCSQTGRRWSPAWVPLGIVYSHTSVLFADASWEFYGAMQAVTHEEWRLEYGASLRMDARYTPSDCFETFPFPPPSPEVAVRGEALYAARQGYMTAQSIGLTSVANLLHNKSIKDVASLRAAHVALDRAVVAAYGWVDLIEKLRHGFYPTKQGERFTIHPDARAEILARLLKLNHERYAEEVKAGLHVKKAKKAATKRSVRPVVENTGDLFEGTK